MVLYMLDTDTCAFVMRGATRKLRRKLLDTPLERQAISVVTLAELLYGVRVSAKPDHNRSVLRDFVRHVAVMDWTEAAAEHYAEIRAHLKTAGQMIGANDLMIAAHARSIEAVIVTNNTREFKRVPALKVENWV